MQRVMGANDARDRLRWGDWRGMPEGINVSTDTGKRGPAEENGTSQLPCPQKGGILVNKVRYT